MSGVEQADYISRRMWLVGIMHLTWVCPGSIPSPAVPIRPCIVAVLGPADRSLAMALPTPLFSAYVYCIEPVSQSPLTGFTLGGQTDSSVLWSDKVGNTAENNVMPARADIQKSTTRGAETSETSSVRYAPAPPNGIRTGCLTVRRICSLIHLFRWLVIWSSRSRISPLNLDSIQLDCPRSTAKFRCYCLTDRKLLPSPMEHREAAQQTFAMSPCRLVAPGTAPLGASRRPVYK